MAHDAGRHSASVGDPSGASLRERDRARLSRALFPELARSLDRALSAQRNAHRASAGSRDATEGQEDFDARLDAEAAERFAGAGLGELAGTAGGSRLLQAFDAARRATAELLAVDGLALPEPEAFEAAGVDLARLAGLLEADRSLVAVPAPYGLGVGAWAEAFGRAAELPESPFSAEDEGDGPLVIGTEALAEFAALDDPAAAAGARMLRGSGTGTNGSVGTGPRRAAGSWGLRLIPAGAEPSVLGLNHAHGGPHVTLPEMLMLQLMRAVSGEPPIDGGDGRGSFTWLAGGLADARLAARHVFDAGTVRITAREVGSQGPHLGARTARV